MCKHCSARWSASIRCGQFPSHDQKERLSAVSISVFRLDSGGVDCTTGSCAGSRQWKRTCVAVNFDYGCAANPASCCERSYAGERNAALSRWRLREGEQRVQRTDCGEPEFVECVCGARSCIHETNQARRCFVRREEIRGTRPSKSDWSRCAWRGLFPHGQDWRSG